MTQQILSSAQTGFAHPALFYRSREEYRTAVAGFVRDGLTVGEPVLVAVPAAHADLVRDALDGRRDGATFTNMAVLGSNPARIIPEVREFIDDHAGSRIRFVGEPIWPSRSAEEVREATRHEALINTAFAHASATILCPYDAAGLEPEVLADAERTHPVLIHDGRTRASSAYTGPTALPSGCDRPLPPPPADADALAFCAPAELDGLRSVVTEWAHHAGLAPDRTAELVLAVSEVAANTLRHTSGGGELHVWRTPDRLVCQINDGGRITDPLAGRRRPPPEALGSRGLWLVNQLCDLAELRSHPTGTTVRLHAQLNTSRG